MPGHYGSCLVERLLYLPLTGLGSDEEALSDHELLFIPVMPIDDSELALQTAEDGGETGDSLGLGQDCLDA